MDKRIILIVVLAYYLVMTFVGLIVMHLDKSRAQKKQWRIKEATLFLVSAVGGSLGTWLGMYLFRHKTRHWYFVVGMPAIFIVHVGLIVRLVMML